MAKKPRKPSATDLKKSLKKIDGEILALLAKRVEACQKLRENETGTTIEKQLSADESDLKAWLATNKSSLKDELIKPVMLEVLSLCRTGSRKVRVAYLGPQYSYSHQAAVEKFGSNADYSPVATIAAVFEEIQRNQANFGLVPVENSNDGRVTDTLEMFAKLPTQICGEVKLHIHHQLLAKCPREEIREVFSKPQALSQCRNWLARHLPAARPIEMTSTAAAAQLAAQQKGAAAIASRAAGLNYQLDTIASNIEDNPNNITRFAVISHQSAPKTGNDKTALLFQTEHKPGALADAMNIFKRNRLNLTWIESFPVVNSPEEYLFFVEMEGHSSELKIRRAISSLEKKALRLEVLGSYQKTEPVN
ncbi:prephenate dehydratase [Blastopirellula marina]|uniref:Bifunctional chorismate mutase/prephenate dehydratase n=1 Tax=Blastopirellula marina TaxID=124 RepID=A0A2S8GCQ4_9BACT|nr:prephenate dehydratase [Blastopirellula marina]PQO42209.1 prephenate dehydratase [Blastopirellula marina]